MALKHIPVGLGPAFVIDERLAYHSKEGSGRILDGLRYDREGQIEADGAEDLPFIQPITVQDQETFPEAGVATAGVRNQVSLFFLVGAKREYGMFSRTPHQEVTGEDVLDHGTGVLEWLMRVRDAIETTPDGNSNVDPLLDGTLGKPITSAVREAPVSDLSWCLLLEVTYDLANTCRGARSISPEESGA